MKKIFLSYIAFTGMLGALFLFAAPANAAYCCLYLEEDDGDDATCLNFSDDQPTKDAQGNSVTVQYTQNTLGACPSGSYPDIIYGAYGNGGNLPQQQIGQDSSEGLMKGCPAIPDTTNADGVLVSYVGQPSSPNEFCKKGVDIVGKDVSKKTVFFNLYYERLAASLKVFEKNGCCVPRDKAGECQIPSFDEKVLNSDRDQNAAAGTWVDAPPDQKLLDYYVCGSAQGATQPASTNAVLYSSDINGLPIGKQYIVYEKTCTSINGTHLPPWAWGTGEQAMKNTPHLLINSMCKFKTLPEIQESLPAVAFHCACQSADQKKCQRESFSTKEGCEKAIVQLKPELVCILQDKSNNYNGKCTPEPAKAKKATPKAASMFSSGFQAQVSGLDPVKSSLQVLIGRMIQVGLGVLGSVALVVFIYGGITWMTAMGNAERTKKALTTFVWGALGVIVILSSYAIVDFVFNSFK